MAFKDLQHASCFNVPKSGCVIKTCWKNLGSLRVEDSFRNLSFMTFKNVGASKISYIVDSHGHIDRSCDKTGSDSIEVEVKNLVSVSSEDIHTLSWSNIPQSTSFINWCSSAHISSELELSAWDLSGMALEKVNWFTWFSVPDLNYRRNTIAVPSKDPVRILSPSALKLSETIYPSCPRKVECYFPVSKSQSFAVWSIDPVAHKLLWGSNATVTTSFLCPAKV